MNETNSTNQESKKSDENEEEKDKATDPMPICDHIFFHSQLR